jgi:hypothetical protein
MLNILRDNPLIAIGAALFAAIVAAAFLLSGGVAPASVGGSAATNDLTLKRVMLSSGGVGYFEYEARVSSGEAVLKLPVRMDQVDDVLKSAVVFDDKGGAGTIQLPSRAPLSDIFKGLPFGPSALDSAPELIAALKGAEVRVSGPDSLEGRIVAVNEETQRAGEDREIVRHRVSVMTSGGLRQFVLEEATSVDFKDAVLQGQIESALKSLSEHREGQARTLTIRSTGDRSRTITVGFVAGAPLWKSSYRITTAEKQDKAWLQGWAVLENVSGADWKDVQLTLASGNPVTFRQALYQTYYVDRPEVPVEIMGRIMPKTDEGAVDVEEAQNARGGERAMPRMKAAPAPVAPPPPPMPAMAPQPEMADAVAEAAPSFDALTGGAPASTAKEEASQVTFTLPGTVTVMNGQSLSVPIVNKQAGATRIALFQPSTHPRNPLNAVKLVNDTGSGLPGGVVTLYHRDEKGIASYVGDARVTAIPNGETRMLAFSLDQKVIVDSAQKFDKTVSKLAIANGVLTASSVDVEETTYTVKGAAGEARSLVIEHPRRPGWTLTAPDPKTAEMTDTQFRIPVAVNAGETLTLKVSSEWPRDDQIALVNLSTEQFMLYANNARLTDAQRAAFSKMAELKRAIDATDSVAQTENQARDRVFEEQARIRENIAAAPAGSDLQRRYTRSMNELEDQAEARKRALDALGKRRQQQLDELNAFIGTLTF